MIPIPISYTTFCISNINLLLPFCLKISYWLYFLSKTFNPIFLIFLNTKYSLINRSNTKIAAACILYIGNVLGLLGTVYCVFLIGYNSII